jgi:hypothetical protein
LSGQRRALSVVAGDNDYFREDGAEGEGLRVASRYYDFLKGQWIETAFCDRYLLDWIFADKDN